MNYLHGEVWVTVVVAEHIPHSLVEHGEESAQGSQAREVHHMIQLGSKVHTLVHQAIW